MTIVRWIVARPVRVVATLAWPAARRLRWTARTNMWI